MERTISQIDKTELSQFEAIGSGTTAYSVRHIYIETLGTTLLFFWTSRWEDETCLPQFTK